MLALVDMRASVIRYVCLSEVDWNEELIDVFILSIKTCFDESTFVLFVHAMFCRHKRFSNSARFGKLVILSIQMMHEVSSQCSNYYRSYD